MQELKNEFYTLVKVEEIRELDSTESNRYVFLWDTLTNNNVNMDSIA